MRRKFNQRGIVGSIIAAGVAVAGLIAFKLWATIDSRSLYGVLRGISIFFDNMAYGLAALVYSIFYELSSSTLLSSLNLASAAQRLYTLLGIFMLFRLAFAFVKYIINPDDIAKGTSKLLTNLAVSLALIVSVPWIFNRAFELQTYIMESNVIGNLIMGMNTTKDTNSDNFNASSYGQTIAFLTFSAFYRPDSSIPALSPCSNLLTYYSPYVVPSGDRTVATSFPENEEISAGVINEANKIAKCVNELNNLTVEDNESGAEVGTLFYIASQRQDLSLITNSGVYKAVYGNYFLIDYASVISTFAGGFLAWLFFCFSFDVAIRNVKLCFLQIIAPIPIILNIEPGDGKKDRPLSWWTKECLNTYLLLFIRVATVYFGVFLITILFGSGFSNVAGSTNQSPFFKVFMILGILMFVKEIPDLIGKAFGIDVKGQFNLNPLKRIGENRIASMATGAALGGIAGLGTGIAAYAGARSNGAKWYEALGRGVTGGIGGALHSGYTGAKTGVKSIGDITKNAAKNLNRSGKIAAANVGTTLTGRTGARLAMAVGAKTKAQRMEETATKLDNFGKTNTAVLEALDKSKDDVGVYNFFGGKRQYTSSSDMKRDIENDTTLSETDKNRLTANMLRAETAEKNLKKGFYVGKGPNRREVHNIEDIEAFEKEAKAKKWKLDTKETEELKKFYASNAKELEEARNVTLDGYNTSTVSDAIKLREVLASNGASYEQLEAVDQQIKNMKQKVIEMHGSDSSTLVGANMDKLRALYDELPEDQKKHFSFATFAEIKGNATQANVESSNILNSKTLTQAKRDADSVKNRREGN